MFRGCNKQKISVCTHYEQRQNRNKGGKKRIFDKTYNRGKKVEQKSLSKNAIFKKKETFTKLKKASSVNQSQHQTDTRCLEQRMQGRVRQKKKKGQTAFCMMSKQPRWIYKYELAVQVQDNKENTQGVINMIVNCED